MASERDLHDTIPKAVGAFVPHSPMSAEIESLKTESSLRRSAGVSPVLIVLTVLALLLAAHAHWRFGQLDGRLERLRDRLVELRDAQQQLSDRLESTSIQSAADTARLRRHIESLAETPLRVAELGRSVEEMRARTEAPQRVWVRAEALYLLELAERRLKLERDTATAIAAMEAADARLATVRDPAVEAVRAQLARELAALRAAPQPDLAAVYARLTALERAATSFAVLGVPIATARRVEPAEAEPRSSLERAWYRVRQASRDMLSLRRVDPDTARLVTLEEEALRRQHLELLLFAARVAVMQQDRAVYVDTLGAADSWLAQYFDAGSAEVAAARAELNELAGIDIDPEFPEIGAAARLLGRVGGNAALDDQEAR
jgi:uroporphyrin-3 C-methyltransferase